MRRFVLPTVIASVLLLALVLTGGFLIRSSAIQAIDANERVRDARNLAAQALAIQLDQETGVRGYALTHAPAFLEPYTRTLGSFDTVLNQLAAATDQLDIPDAAASIVHARATHQRWLDDVAGPLLKAHLPDSAATEQEGKDLVDDFRTDINRIDALLRMREERIAADTRAAIARINLLITLASLIVIAAASVYGTLEYRAAARLSKEEERAAALEAAYVAEKRIADTLQEAFTQRPLPELPTLRFSATYVPATELTRVGGDWYDALELPEHRVLFAIGDVTGHGIDAAVTMNRTRQALISSALLDPDPASLLDRLNREAIAEGGPIVTAIAGYADAMTYEFVYAIAGHPPPVLLEPGRPPRMLDCGSVPLGADASTAYQARHVQTVPGATLVLYTDGAVEHSRDVVEGEALLLRAVEQARAAAPPDPAEFIQRAIFDGRAVRDDVAILTIGFATSSAPGIRLSAGQASAGFSGHITRGDQDAGMRDQAA